MKMYENNTHIYDWCSYKKWLNKNIPSLWNIWKKKSIKYLTIYWKVGRIGVLWSYTYQWKILNIGISPYPHALNYNLMKTIKVPRLKYTNIGLLIQRRTSLKKFNLECFCMTLWSIFRWFWNMLHMKLPKLKIFLILNKVHLLQVNVLLQFSQWIFPWSYRHPAYMKKFMEI